MRTQGMPVFWRMLSSRRSRFSPFLEARSLKAEVLGDEGDFFDAALFELLGFFGEALDGAGLHAYARNGAEGTVAVAAFGDFEIGVVRVSAPGSGAVVRCRAAQGCGFASSQQVQDLPGLVGAGPQVTSGSSRAVFLRSAG